MAVGIVDRQKLVNISDAVRAKKGITGEMTLDAIASNITSIPISDNNAKYDFTGSGSKSEGDLRSYLTTVDLTGLDTSSYTRMFQLFYNCSSLTNLDLSNLDTTNVTDMSNMFSSCSSLNSLDLSSFNTSKVTDMRSMFDNCKSLTSINLSSFDTSKVTDMRSMFNGCSSIETLDLSNFDFSNMDSGDYSGINSLVYDCMNLKTIIFPSTLTFNNSGVSFNDMFNGCNSLTILDLSGFNTTNVNSMYNMFYSCSSLTTLDLSNWNTSNVTDMGRMFQNCNKLTNLTLGNDWASNSSISSFKLSSCPLTHESAVDVINKLATRSNSPVIEFSNKVTLFRSEINVATNKGWSVSGCLVLG